MKILSLIYYLLNFDNDADLKIKDLVEILSVENMNKMLKCYDNERRINEEKIAKRAQLRIILYQILENPEKWKTLKENYEEAMDYQMCLSIAMKIYRNIQKCSKVFKDGSLQSIAVDISNNNTIRKIRTHP
jgi:hypothetical protein